MSRDECGKHSSLALFLSLFTSLFLTHSHTLYLSHTHVHTHIHTRTYTYVSSFSTPPTPPHPPTPYRDRQRAQRLDILAQYDTDRRFVCWGPHHIDRCVYVCHQSRVKNVCMARRKFATNSLSS